jgi:hypothetical protein
MHTLFKLVVWLALTVGFQLMFIALYGVYEAGLGPYQCGFLDAGHHCGIVEYMFNKLFLANLAVGIPTIISGIISLIIVRRAMRDIHI